MPRVANAASLSTQVQQRRLAIRPPISVIIPTYNAARTLPETLASVRALEHPVELLVVDDGSTDATVAIAEAEPGARVLRRSHQGIGPTRNAGVAAARGELLAFLDADDRFTPAKLRVQLPALEGAELVFGHVRQFLCPSLDPGEAAKLRVDTAPTPGYLLGALLLSRESFARVGPFREDLTVGEFVDWMARAREAGLREVCVPEVVLERRVHASNTGRRERSARGDYVAVLKAALDRRRKREP